MRARQPDGMLRAQQPIQVAAEVSEYAGIDSNRLGGEILELLRTRVADHICDSRASPALSLSSCGSPGPHVPAALAAGHTGRAPWRDGFSTPMLAARLQPLQPVVHAGSRPQCGSTGGDRHDGASSFASCACGGGAPPFADSSMYTSHESTPDSASSQSSAGRIRALSTLARSNCDGIRVALSALDDVHHDLPRSRDGADSDDGAHERVAASLHRRRCCSRALRCWVQQARERTLMRLSSWLSSRATVRGAFDTWLRCIIAEAKLELAKRHFGARASMIGADTASHVAAAQAPGSWPDCAQSSRALDDMWARLASLRYSEASAGGRMAGAGAVARHTPFVRPVCVRLRRGLVQWRRAARRARRLLATRTAALERSSMALASRAIGMALRAWVEAVGRQRIEADQRGRDARIVAAVTEAEAAWRIKVRNRMWCPEGGGLHDIRSDGVCDHRPDGAALCLTEPRVPACASDASTFNALHYPTPLARSWSVRSRKLLTVEGKLSRRNGSAPHPLKAATLLLLRAPSARWRRSWWPNGAGCSMPWTSSAQPCSPQLQPLMRTLSPWPQ